MKRLIVPIVASIVALGRCHGQELVWSEEFDVLDTNFWDFDVGGGGWHNRELQEYRKENVRVENGKLVIRIQQESDGNITSGRIFSKVDFSEFRYGTIEASIKLPDMEHGLWPSFWMLGSNYEESIFPASGAIKVLEGGSGNAREQGFSLNSRVGSSIYWEDDGGSTISGEHQIDTPFGLTSDFHIYELQWTPERITTFVGGIEIFSQDISSRECEEIHQGFILILNVAAGGNYPRIFESSEVLPSLPTEMEVDYIRLFNNSYTQRGLAPSAPTYGDQPPPTYVDQFPRPSPVLPPSMAPVFVAESPLSPFVGFFPEPTPLPVAPTPAPFTPAPSTAVPTTSDPTASPTTEEPTISPTKSSSKQPSPAPMTTEPDSVSSTSEPTFQPSSSPTDEPSTSPTVSPSSSPSLTPTVPPLQQLTAAGSIMELYAVEPLDSVETLTWQQVTHDHLLGEIEDNIDGELVDLSVTLTSQDPPYVVGRRNMFRRLQGNRQEITFDTVLTIKSAKDDLDANSFVEEAFATDTQKETYLDELQGSDSAFANVEEMTLTQGESGVSEIISAPATDGGGVNTSGVPFIVGIVVAAVVVAFVGLFIVSRHRRKRTQRRKSASGTAVRPPGGSTGREAYPIEVDELDDSLYDFDLQVPTQRTSFDDTSGIFTSQSSVTMDYDDQVALQKASIYASPETGAPPPGGPAVTESYKRRASAQFYRFTVDAPSGLLGMVLESSVEGTPSVYGIKNTSPLASDVQVGDRLVRVDGLDVSEMDATAVSRLIASKKMNKYRNLVFVRPTDHDEGMEPPQ